ncbi:hypothetical protein AMTR_s00096p00149300 [Amborella trichopoda]|uniref:Uncharacterized protein n=1 Tax=Amborella trichopoda TaxID=13333 RepID=W1P443_AMBTC|nr:hypothetical protein AMTR_s00096p00149300 [Amborella trichopoda]
MTATRFPPNPSKLSQSHLDLAMDHYAYLNMIDVMGAAFQSTTPEVIASFDSVVKAAPDMANMVYAARIEVQADIAKIPPCPYNGPFDTYIYPHPELYADDVYAPPKPKPRSAPSLLAPQPCLLQVVQPIDPRVGL